LVTPPIFDAEGRRGGSPASRALPRRFASACGGVAPSALLELVIAAHLSLAASVVAGAGHGVAVRGAAVVLDDAATERLPTTGRGDESPDGAPAR
jgi:hypothetical protein